MRYPKMILIIIMVLFIFSFTIQAANYGGELNIKLQQRPINLNPIYAANKAEKIISQQIFDSLVTLNAEGELIPNLAKTWEINNQARVFRFKLRENIYFHPFQINGALSSLSKRRVTAADWKWSLEYLAASENKSPYANLLNKVKGYEEYRQGRSKEISGIKILDDYLLEIELKESYAPFIYNLTENAAVVLPEQAVINNSKFFMEPIGTGAFVLNNFNPDQIILKKFDNYWKNNYRKEKLPYLDRIKIDFSANESEIKEYHNYDIYQLSSELYQKYSELEKTDNYQLKKTAENIYYYLGYNYNSSLKKVISDQNIKEYLRNSLNEINLEQNDDLLSFIFPFQYSKEASYIDQINNLVKKNNDNNLKDEAYPEQLNLVSNDSKNNKVIADLIKNELQDKKIKLNLSQFSWSEYLNLIKSKDFKSELFIMSYNYHNKFEFLADNFYSESELNYFNYSNRRVDNLIDYLKLVSSKKDQEKAYKLIEEILLEDNPLILVLQGGDPYLFSNKIANQKLEKVLMSDNLEQINFK